MRGKFRPSGPTSSGCGYSAVAPVMASCAPVQRKLIMTRPTRKTLLASLLILFWAAALLTAYRWYEARYLRSFSEQTALFLGEQLRLPAELAGPGPIRLVHFWDPACRGNVGNQQPLAELIEHSRPLGVAFYGVQKATPSGR